MRWSSKLLPPLALALPHRSACIPGLQPMTRAGCRSSTARRSTAGRSTAGWPSTRSRTGPSSAPPSRAARTPSSARGTSRTSSWSWRSSATPGSTPASRSAATSTARTGPTRSTQEQRKGVVYGPQCEIARKETGTAGRFYDEGRRGKWLAEIKPEAEGRLQGRRLEPLPDRRAGQPLSLVGQRGRRRPTSPTTWTRGLHRPPGPRHPKGEGPYQVRWRNIRIKELKPG